MSERSSLILKPNQLTQLAAGEILFMETEDGILLTVRTTVETDTGDSESQTLKPIQLTTQRKVELFESLFAGRTDVFAS